MSTAVCAEPLLRDVHLSVVPRAPEDAARVARVTAPTTDFTKAERFEVNQGGATTVRARNSTHAFSQPSDNLTFEQELTFKVGNGLFKKLWVSSPSSTQASDGLGPLYNARSCQRCHLKDGRGHPPEGPDDTAVSMLMRLSVPGGAGVPEIEGYLADRAHPVYGRQLQDFGIAGHAAEGQIHITYTEETIALAGGETATLRTPTYSVVDPGYGALGDDVMLSARVAP